MKRPKKVSILGHKYEIKWEQPPQDHGPDQQTFGDSDHANGIIHVDPSLSTPQQRSTLLHEILHAIIFNAGLHFEWPKKFDLDEREEDVVNRLSAPLALALAQNRPVFAWISGEE